VCAAWGFFAFKWVFFDKGKNYVEDSGGGYKPQKRGYAL
jgi:hypothetical protein